MQLTIELTHGNNILDELGIISDAYAAIDDLLSGVVIHETERERLSTLLHLLGTVQRTALEHLIQQRRNRCASAPERHPPHANPAPARSRGFLTPGHGRSLTPTPLPEGAGRHTAGFACHLARIASR